MSKTNYRAFKRAQLTLALGEEYSGAIRPATWSLIFQAINRLRDRKNELEKALESVAAGRAVETTVQVSTRDVWWSANDLIGKLERMPGGLDVRVKDAIRWWVKNAIDIELEKLDNV